LASSLLQPLLLRCCSLPTTSSPPAACTACLAAWGPPTSRLLWRTKAVPTSTSTSTLPPPPRSSLYCRRRRRRCCCARPPASSVLPWLWPRFIAAGHKVCVGLGGVGSVPCLSSGTAPLGKRAVACVYAQAPKQGGALILLCVFLEIQNVTFAVAVSPVSAAVAPWRACWRAGCRLCTCKPWNRAVHLSVRAPRASIRARIGAAPPQRMTHCTLAASCVQAGILKGFDAQALPPSMHVTAHSLHLAKSEVYHDVPVHLCYVSDVHT
jgi:hypothetical protein